MLVLELLDLALATPVAIAGLNELRTQRAIARTAASPRVTELNFSICLTVSRRGRRLDDDHASDAEALAELEEKGLVEAVERALSEAVERRREDAKSGDAN